jgi:hypothetical protein
MNYAVTKIEERFADDGHGFDFDRIGGTSSASGQVSTGWWAVLKDGAVPCGPNRPDLREGDRIEVQVRKL